MRTINEQVKNNPVLFDLVIEEAKQCLLSDLNWLDQAFGRAWTINRLYEKKKYAEPCIYTKGNSYETLVPSADLGNFCFFVLRDPNEITDNGKVTTTFSCIFWVDLVKCFSNKNRRDTENIKNDILMAFRDCSFTKGGAIVIDRCYEEANNVWRGYTLDEADNQYMIHPYAGFRFEGRMLADEPCDYSL